MTSRCRYWMGLDLRHASGPSPLPTCEFGGLAGGSRGSFFDLSQDGQGGAVVYWMPPGQVIFDRALPRSRDQRAEDNWALLKAQELALAHKASAT